jgi:hypothetical protein
MVFLCVKDNGFDAFVVGDIGYLYGFLCLLNGLGRIFNLLFGLVPLVFVILE